MITYNTHLAKGSIDGGLRKSISFSVRIDTLSRNFGHDGNSIESNDITRNHAVQADDLATNVFFSEHLTIANISLVCT